MSMNESDLDALALEIRLQGYDELSAWRYAQLIGDTPVFDERGNIVVREDDGTVLATLKPLKFFAEE